MRRFALIATILAVLGGVPAPAHAGIGATLVKGGLAFPTAFAFVPNGTRIFYLERFSGEIRLLNLTNGNDTLFYTVPNIVSDGERGLLGITLHPDYPTRPYVYVYATRSVTGAKNQLIRLTNSGRTGTGFKALASFTSVSGYHNGGAIRVGPDRRLYALVGDGHNSANAQTLDNNLGKVCG
ncbi:MAG TPA: PQQ-dependent sugar dehydrogenase [Actinomycetota bacterium]|nr:PQQ-dependent sugar dehydrogenase [Actinomycetota bacterium]